MNYVQETFIKRTHQAKASTQPALLRCCINTWLPSLNLLPLWAPTTGDWCQQGILPYVCFTRKNKPHTSARRGIYSPVESYKAQSSDPALTPKSLTCHHILAVTSFHSTASSSSSDFHTFFAVKRHDALCLKGVSYVICGFRYWLYINIYNTNILPLVFFCESNAWTFISIFISISMYFALSQVCRVDQTFAQYCI